MLRGGDNNDVIRGQVGEDEMEVGTGDDRLLGGGGSDWFVFAGRFGADRVTDFTDGDILDLSAQGLSFDDAMANAWQNGGDGRIELTSGTIVLENVHLAELESSDFLFGASLPDFETRTRAKEQTEPFAVTDPPASEQVSSV